MSTATPSAESSKITGASVYIAQKLGLPAEAVHVGVGTDPRGYNASSTTDDLGRHVFAITITHPKVAENFAEMEKSSLLALAPLEAFKGLVQFESDAANVVHRRDQMEKFRLAGAAIPENFKNWIGFNPDRVDRWDSIPKHALQNINRDEKRGVTFTINIPEGEEAGKTGGAVKASLESRKDAIKALLQARAVKYLTRGMDAGQKAAKTAEIAAKFAGLTIEVQYNEPALGEHYSSSGSITVTIASKEQKESDLTFKDKVMTPADKEVLRNTNPLTASNPDKSVNKEEYALSGAELSKALGRSVLFEGEKGHCPTEIFPLIAGKEDMKIAIAKELVRFKQANPASAKEVDDFLNDEAFKGSDWNKPKRLQQEHKTAPEVVKDAADPAKRNVMSIQFNLKAENAQALLDKLAAGQVTAASPLPSQTQAPLADALETAAKAITAAADKIGTWAERLESERALPALAAAAPAVNASATGDQAIANAILASVGAVATPAGAAAGAVAASGLWTERAAKPAAEPQLTASV